MSRWRTRTVAAEAALRLGFPFSLTDVASSICLGEMRKLYRALVDVLYNFPDLSHLCVLRV